LGADRIELSQQQLRAALGASWPPDQVDAAIALLADSDGRFPSGVRKLPSELVRAIQRERLIAAILKATADLGYRRTNVQDVIDRAGVSRPTFYEHFANKEDCFLAAFDTSAQRLRDRVEGAALDGSSWREQVRFGMRAVLDFAVAEPDTLRTVVVEARAASAEAVLRRVELLDHFSACLDTRARALLPADLRFTEVTAAGVVGGIEALLYARLCKSELDQLEKLFPSMVYFAVLPYEGHAAASEELALHTS
jgi:AcrR family transcriptional regulator